MKMEKYFVILLIIAGVAIFFGGYEVASQEYEQKFTEAKTKYLEKVHALEVRYREKERSSAEALIAAWDDRDRARLAVDVRNRAFERVRIELSDARRQLSETPSDSCPIVRKELATCTRLLESGAGLVERGAGMVGTLAADKDAVVRIHNGK